MQRNVRGSEAEKDVLRHRFRAMRVWGGLSSLFFTLNPNDIRSPLTLAMIDEGKFHVKHFSLDMSDADTDAYLSEMLSERPRLLHEMVAQDPVAATRCFHYTVRLVIETLFSCTTPGEPYPDGIPAHVVPGVFGHIAGYLGVVEPQMRKALHIHMLIQLHGFSHPADLISSGKLADVFRRIWSYVASICFRSVEGFAAYLNEPAALEILKEKPMLPVTPKQTALIGNHRTKETMKAQKEARQINHEPVTCAEDKIVRHFVPTTYADPEASVEKFAAQAAAEVNAGTLKTGNHVCRPDVCYKGRLGKQGFCRMGFWHWVKYTNDKGQLASRRCHGKPLQSRWNGVGEPPVCKAPPSRGLPELEMNHPFHFKMTPSMLLGPRCNHDLGVLIRLPIVSPEVFTKNTTSNLCDEDAMKEWEDALREMVETMIDHEFYCATYASKEQPHIEGLLQSLADGVRGLDREIAERVMRGDPQLEPLERGKRVLNRLMSSTNRRMHKGYPEMLSYLLNEPSYYCSHSFINLMFHDTLRIAGKHVQEFAAGTPPTKKESLRELRENRFVHVNQPEDYMYRPTALNNFPWYTPFSEMS